MLRCGIKSGRGCAVLRQDGKGVCEPGQEADVPVNAGRAPTGSAFVQLGAWERKDAGPYVTQGRNGRCRTHAPC